MDEENPPSLGALSRRNAPSVLAAPAAQARPRGLPPAEMSEWLFGISPGNPPRDLFRKEIVAGLTVALVGLPQCLAYALMSGLPPAYGLSTAAAAGLIAALIGKSAQIVTGPTNTTSLLI